MPSKAIEPLHFLLTRLELDLGGATKLKTVRIQPGSFSMGSPEKEVYRDGEEELHKVQITQPFFMGIHEVTRGQFRAFVQAENYRTEPEQFGQGGLGYNPDTKDFVPSKHTWRDPGFEQTDEHPVLNVSWNDAMAFCAWLSRKEGKTIDLPTEAEWEYACRAGTSTSYFTGDKPPSLQGAANIADLSFKAKYNDAGKQFDDAKRIKEFDWHDGHPFTSPVGTFRTNAWGLHDMHGNVSEWCKDWYDKDYYKNSPLKDPPGPLQGEQRVLRGGSFSHNAKFLRAAYRGRSAPSGSTDGYGGFRVIVRPTPTTK
jgi:formylglycine-generating enzyme required for sulfatase activity